MMVHVSQSTTECETDAHVLRDADAACAHHPRRRRARSGRGHLEWSRANDPPPPPTPPRPFAVTLAVSRAPRRWLRERVDPIHASIIWQNERNEWAPHRVWHSITPSSAHVCRGSFLPRGRSCSGTTPRTRRWRRCRRWTAAPAAQELCCSTWRAAARLPRHRVATSLPHRTVSDRTSYRVTPRRTRSVCVCAAWHDVRRRGPRKRHTPRRRRRAPTQRGGFKDSPAMTQPSSWLERIKAPDPQPSHATTPSDLSRRRPRRVRCQRRRGVRRPDVLIRRGGVSRCVVERLLWRGSIARPVSREV